MAEAIGSVALEPPGEVAGDPCGEPGTGDVVGFEVQAVDRVIVAKTSSGPIGRRGCPTGRRVSMAAQSTGKGPRSPMRASGLARIDGRHDGD